jgi:hypothetical protein
MKVKAEIAFYDFKPLQKKWYYIICLLSWSRHTHAHIEFRLKEPFAFIVNHNSKIRALKLELLLQMGVKKYYSYDLGELNMNELDIKYASNYIKLNIWKMIAYQIGGKFLGMKQPTSCVTFICDYLRFHGWETPNLFTPKELWEILHDSNNVRWSRPCGKDNTSKVVK